MKVDINYFYLTIMKYNYNITYDYVDLNINFRSMIFRDQLDINIIGFIVYLKIYLHQNNTYLIFNQNEFDFKFNIISYYFFLILIKFCNYHRIKNEYLNVPIK
jgi:hypothetical protein